MKEDSVVCLANSMLRRVEKSHKQDRSVWLKYGPTLKAEQLNNVIYRKKNE